MKLELRTPCCNRKVGETDLFEVAVSVIRRTCPRCRERYVVKISPLSAKRAVGYVHQLDWTPIGGGGLR